MCCYIVLVYPAFFSEQVVSVAENPHGYIGSGEEYLYRFINLPKPIARSPAGPNTATQQPPNGYHGPVTTMEAPAPMVAARRPNAGIAVHRSQLSKNFSYYQARLVISHATSFVKLEIIHLKIGNITNCSALQTIYPGANTTYYIIPDKFELAIEGELDLDFECPMLAIYPQLGGSIKIDLKDILVEEGYTFTYTSGQYISKFIGMKYSPYFF